MAENRKGRLLPDPSKQEIITCATCGGVVTRYKSNGNRFCSRVCAALNEQVQKKRIATFNAIPKTNAYSRCSRGWREIGGKRIFFRSAWEANYARYLEYQKMWGLIEKWEYEPETFWFDGIKRGVRSYLPDFRVADSKGEIQYHEVKGWMDAKSLTKLNRMRIYHPEVQIVVRDSKWFSKLSGTLKICIPDWESPNKP